MPKAVHPLYQPHCLAVKRIGGGGVQDVKIGRRQDYSSVIHR